MENKDHFGADDFNLEENVDFFLNIEFDENSNVKGSIKCKCNKSISLANNDDKLQVSNYYKHLQSMGCDHMKNKIKDARNARPIEQQQQSSKQLPFASSPPSHSSLVPVPSTSIVITETTTHDESPRLSNENVRGGKRRLAAQSQQINSAKRSRL